MERIIDFFTVQKSSKDADYVVKERLFVLYLLFTLVLSILMIPTYIYLEVKILLYLLYFLFGGCVSLLFYFKQTENLKVSSILFILLTLIFLFFNIIFTGSISSVLVIWLIILPILAILLNNGLIAFSIIGCCLVLSLLLIFEYYGISFPNEFDIKGGIYLNFFSRINFMFSVVLLVYLYDDKSKEDKELLEKSNKELEQFAYVASHDMKAPLRNMMSFTQLLQRKMEGKLEQSEANYFDHILSNGYQINELIQGILDISRIEQQEVFDRREVDLNLIIERVEKRFENLFQDRNVVLEYHNLPFIFVNEPQIIQLFQNLIENGIKYNRSEQPVLKITHRQVNDKMNIFIEDNGIGISKQYHDKIFEMFKRLHSGYEFKGTGIGLAICKKIAIRHHGDLMVHQSSQKGTIFKLSLPIN